ncbi:MAG: triose-phosphate isomerase [Anaerolineales bacterium]
MRVPLIAGNWKMNKTEQEAIALVRVLIQRLDPAHDVEVLICPPFTSLSQLNKFLVSSSLLLGAQNISKKTSGAFTGEISGVMAAEFCTHVILGHSERRAYFGETDDLINQKVKTAQDAGLIPILCIGETLEEKDSGLATSVLTSQLKTGLKEIFCDDPSRLIIAYEPVWAIGTGRTAAAAEISDLIARVIRPVLGGLWGEKAANQIRILYGGSVKPANAGSFFNQLEIDGALVGGASLFAEDFLGIIEKAS